MSSRLREILLLTFKLLCPSRLPGPRSLRVAPKPSNNEAPVVAHANLRQSVQPRSELSPALIRARLLLAVDFCLLRGALEGWKSAREGTVLATEAVETQGKGGVLPSISASSSASLRRTFADFLIPPRPLPDWWACIFAFAPLVLVFFLPIPAMSATAFGLALAAWWPEFYFLFLKNRRALPIF